MRVSAAPPGFMEDLREAVIAIIGPHTWWELTHSRCAAHKKPPKPSWTSYSQLNPGRVSSRLVRLTSWSAFPATTMLDDRACRQRGIGRSRQVLPCAAFRHCEFRWGIERQDAGRRDASGKRSR
jgi:hypothetical protein